MNNKIYLDDYSLTYEKTLKYLNYLTDSRYYKSKSFIKKYIGNSDFFFKINSYLIGNGKNHIIIIDSIYNHELLATYFVLEIMLTLLLDSNIFYEYKNYFTFHFIPMLNFKISGLNKYLNNLLLDENTKLLKIFICSTKYHFTNPLSTSILENKNRFFENIKSIKNKLN